MTTVAEPRTTVDDAPPVRVERRSPAPRVGVVEVPCCRR